MNIRYFGPVDGHDVLALTKVLKEIKDMKGPKLMHVHIAREKDTSLPKEQRCGMLPESLIRKPENVL